MPVPSMFGAYGALNGPAAFFSVQNCNIGANTIILPANVAVGDFVLLCAQDNSAAPAISGAGGTGWTLANFAVTTGGVYRRIMTSTQIAGPIVLTFSSVASVCLIILIKKGSTLNALSTGQGLNGTGVDTNSWTGVTKTVGSLGLVMVVAEFTSSSPGAMGISSPALPNLVNLPTSVNAHFSSDMRIRAFADFTPAEYTNGTAIVTNNLGTTWSQASFHVYDVS